MSTASISAPVKAAVLGASTNRRVRSEITCTAAESGNLKCKLDRHVTLAHCAYPQCTLMHAGLTHTSFTPSRDHAALRSTLPYAAMQCRAQVAWCAVLSTLEHRHVCAALFCALMPVRALLVCVAVHIGPCACLGRLSAARSRPHSHTRLLIHIDACA